MTRSLITLVYNIYYLLKLSVSASCNLVSLTSVIFINCFTENLFKLIKRCSS